MVVLGALTATAPVALAIGIGFGLVRGLAVLMTRHLTDPAALRSFHRRFADIGPRVGRAVVVVELACRPGDRRLAPIPVGPGPCRRCGVRGAVAVVVITRAGGPGSPLPATADGATAARSGRPKVEAPDGPDGRASPLVAVGGARSAGGG